MATIDTTNLSGSFDISNPDSVNHAAQGTVTAFSYGWTTTGGNTVTALGTGITASATAPTGGIISAITIGTGGAGLLLGDLDLSLTAIVNVTNAATHQDLFWNAVLANATDITLGGIGDFSIAGDYAVVRAGQVRGGVRDYFTQDGPGGSGSRIAIGDAGTVLAGGTLTGGADLFTEVTYGALIGDAQTVGGSVTGGADRFTATGRVISGSPADTLTTVIGDVSDGQAGSSITGGADTIILQNINAGSIVGDANQALGGFSGGDDTISLTRNGPGMFMPLSGGALVGDALSVANGTPATPLAAAVGGDDTISLTDAGGSLLTGDFGTVAGRSITGGDDTISLTSVVPAPSFPPLPVSPLPLSIVAGDAYQATASFGSTTVTGGNDTITFSQTLLAGTVVVGDVTAFAVDSGLFQGGDDTISLTFTRTDVPGGLSVFLFGDAQAVSYGTSGTARFGDDTISADLRAPVPVGTIFVVGDAQVATIGGPGGVIGFGDDTITVQASSGGNIIVFGDGDGFTLADGRTDWGADRITTGGGNDTIYGDGGAGSTIEGQIGGDDIIDAQGGDDAIIGGFGIDTAVYATLDRAVTVFLEGVPGQGGSVQAIGQGRDSLTGIENIIGSRRADIIVGDDNANTLEGGAGNDALDGDGGLGDVVSYASSTGAVTVRLWNQTATGGHAQGDRIGNFEGAIGSAYNDVLIGRDAQDNTLRGGAGADYLDGLTGEDWADYTGSTGNVTARLWNDTGSGGDAQGDTLANIEHLTGSAMNDALIGQDSQNNSLQGMGGADYLDGLTGTDTASYAASDASVTVRLFNGTGEGGHAQGDTLANIENLVGSRWSDSLIGADTVANSIEGGSGSDFLAGLSGNDLLYGGALSYGNDTLRGGAGADSLYGGDGSDIADYTDSATGVIVRLWNGTGQNGDAQGDVLSGIEILHGSAQGDNLQGRTTEDDTLRGNAGADYLDGISGLDTADYSNAAGGVIIRLWNGTGQNSDAQGDTLANIDRVVGSASGDNLQGKDGSSETLEGGAGADYLNGFTGSDWLDGGAGNDTLDGGGNGDRFVFARGYGQDTVVLFENGSDLVDLEGLVFADLTLSSIAGGVRVAIAGDIALGRIDLMGVVLGDITSGDFT